MANQSNNKNQQNNKSVAESIKNAVGLHSNSAY